MKKKFRRLISMVLIFSMLISVLPTVTIAAESTQDPQLKDLIVHYNLGEEEKQQVVFCTRQRQWLTVEVCHLGVAAYPEVMECDIGLVVALCSVCCYCLAYV